MRRNEGNSVGWDEWEALAVIGLRGSHIAISKTYPSDGDRYICGAGRERRRKLSVTSEKNGKSR